MTACRCCGTDVAYAGQRHQPCKPCVSIVLGPKHQPLGKAWSRRVEVDGVAYWVGVAQGKKVRIAFKPRGPGAYGYRWHGYVRTEQGRDLWSAEVPGSLGARGILADARVIFAAAVARGLCALGGQTMRTSREAGPSGSSGSES